MNKKKEKVKVKVKEKERKFVKDQISKMRLKNTERDLLRSKWGNDIFMSESQIKKILNRKENL